MLLIGTYGLDPLGSHLTPPPPELKVLLGLNEGFLSTHSVSKKVHIYKHLVSEWVIFSTLIVSQRIFAIFHGGTPKSFSNPSAPPSPDSESLFVVIFGKRDFSRGVGNILVEHKHILAIRDNTNLLLDTSKTIV